MTSDTSPEIYLSLSLSPSAGTRPRPTTDPALSYPTPTDLRFSNLGSREVKLHWTNPAGPVQQYRVVYHSAEDHKAKEVRSTHTDRKRHTGTVQNILKTLIRKEMYVNKCMLAVT